MEVAAFEIRTAVGVVAVAVPVEAAAEDVVEDAGSDEIGL